MAEERINVVQGTVNTGGGAFQMGSGGIASGNHGDIHVHADSGALATTNPPAPRRFRPWAWFAALLGYLGTLATLIQFIDWLGKR